jgi:hypothetical protein
LPNPHFFGTHSKIQWIVASGGEDGVVECFDIRSTSSMGKINIPAVSSEDYNQVLMYHVFPWQQEIY